jgi:hypothetical protein
VLDIMDQGSLGVDIMDQGSLDVGYNGSGET